MFKKKIRAMAYLPWWKVRSNKRIHDNMQVFDELIGKTKVGYQVSKAQYGDVLVCAFDLVVFGNRFNVKHNFNKTIELLEDIFGHKLKVEIELEVD